MALPNLIAARSSTGIEILHCSFDETDPFKDFQKDCSKCCRTSVFSKDGNLFAWTNGTSVIIISLPGCEKVLELPLPKTACLAFSPLGNLLATWEPYSAKQDNSSENCNLQIWDIKNGACLRRLIQKRQLNWDPQWSDDEAICARNVNNEVHFFENNKFDEIAKKIHLHKVAEFKLSSGPPPYHVACYVPGSKGQPSFIRLFQYPRFEGNSAAIANKSFYKADRVEMKWNQKGTAVLILTITDVDKSGSSYYGEQTMHYVSTSGETVIVQLAKNGPIYSAEWNPNSLQFCVVYGFMPAKATVFNLKCEPVFDYGTGPRNEIYYNPTGSLLLLAGFGNLRGNVEIWDTRSNCQVIQVIASDTTYLEWCPDGQHFITATTTPRLRVGNGYRLWHYTGKLLYNYSWEENEELYEVNCKPYPSGTFQDIRPISKSVAAAQSSSEVPEKQVYRPPQARGQPSTFKLHDNEELPSNMKQQENLSKNALKNKKKRDQKKAKKEQSEEPNSVKEVEVRTAEPVTRESSANDPEKEKKIRNLRKKLEQIQKLKEMQTSGKKLELNQLEKIKKEEELIQELEMLEV